MRAGGMAKIKKLFEAAMAFPMRVRVSPTRLQASFDNITYAARRLKVEKTSEARPGKDFIVNLPQSRGAYTVPANESSVGLTWV